MILLLILLVSLCLIQFLYILKIHHTQKEWLEMLQHVKAGSKDKLFTKNNGILSEISYELNDILEDNQSKILKLKKAEEANAQILTSLSHDVRTPLASLLGYLEALSTNCKPSLREEYLGVALRKANDLKTFIDMLFDWFKLNSDEQRLHMESLDVNELTREVLISWLPAFQKEQIRLTATIPDEELLLFLDKMEYTRILNNLIQNALRHGRCSQIAISINTDNSHALINVFNNGDSIPAQNIPHIFDRLYKCDDSRTEKGNGLGLSIVKELTSAMNGTISVSSTPETGTVFSLLFPVK